MIWRGGSRSFVMMKRRERVGWGGHSIFLCLKGGHWFLDLIARGLQVWTWVVIQFFRIPDSISLMGHGFEPRSGQT